MKKRLRRRLLALTHVWSSKNKESDREFVRLVLAILDELDILKDAKLGRLIKRMRGDCKLSRFPSGRWSFYTPLDHGSGDTPEEALKPLRRSEYDT